jgi:predicted ABC-type ATPase
MPHLIIIAGPNGAGKSEYTKRPKSSIIQEFKIPSFDYDVEFAKIYTRFESIMTLEIEKNIEIQTKNLFEEKALLAIKKNKNFSFQTNFDKVYTDKWRKAFTKQGYKTHLYFLYLPNIKICSARVKKRVKLGGHHVPYDQIVKRFEKGLKNLDKSALSYDNLKILDTSLSENKLLAQLKNGKIEVLDKSFISIIKEQNLIKLGNHIKSELVKLK